MHIRLKMMHPELRLPGAVIHVLWSRYTMRRFRLCNTLLRTFVKGHAITPTVAYRQVQIPRPDGTLLRLCVYTPHKTPDHPVPGLLWLHGGGYAIGLPEQDFMFIKRFVKAGCVVVAPDYTRSVDAPFPAALLDCYQALLWLRDHSKELGVRDDQLFVGGDSAGGGLTASLCFYARDRGEVSIAFQMPLYPMLDDRMITPSSQGNDAPVWTSRSNRLAWDLYLGDQTSELLPYAAPGRRDDVQGLPPALTFVGSIEMFRDETLQYTDKLRAAGIDARVRVFDGCFHGSDMLCFWTIVSHKEHRFLLTNFAHAANSYFKAQPEKC